VTVAAPDDTTVREHTYVPALDGLRAVAVLLVMAQHLHAFVFPASSFLPKGGYLGVDLFFVLSGFLITSLLLQERARTGGVSFRRFYRRRAFRLFPALAAFIVVQAVAALVAGQSLRDQVNFWFGAFTYTTNWVLAMNWSVPANTGHLWSLAVEEQFYLVWPIALVLAMRRWGTRAVPVLCVAGVGIAVVARVYLTHRFGFGYPLVYLHTETRLDGLLLGALVAWARHTGWRPPSRVSRSVGWIGLAVVGLYVLGTNPTDQFLYEAGGYTVLAVAGTAVLIGLLEPAWTPGRLLATPLPVAVGKLSYSLYLWHMLVVFTLLSYLQRQSLPVGVAVFVTASFSLAIVSYRFVERPLRAFGHATKPEPAVAAAPPRATARRPTWAVAGAGAVALIGLAAVPAYAQRDEILGRDRAVAAALAAQEGQTPTTTPPLAEGAPAQPVTLTVETPATTPPPGTAEPSELVVAATLLDASGLPLADRSIRFDSTAGECAAATDELGRASCTMALPEAPEAVPEGQPPVHGVEAIYEGDDVSVSATASWP
jgi:peptidoglycan/LPS O-acetylase OafA/YrhL